MANDETYAADALIDLAPAPPLPDKKDFEDPPPPGGASNPPVQPPHVPFNYPPPGGAAANPNIPPYPGASGGFTIPPNVPPNDTKPPQFDDGPPPAYFPPDLGAKPPQRQPSIEDNLSRDAGGANGDTSGNDQKLDLPDLPGVPTDSPLARVSPGEEDEDEKKENNDEDIDFDDLTRRFEALKKKK